MANNVMFNVKPSFEIESFATKLSEIYRMKGYAVNVAFMNNSAIITFEKNTGGMNMLLGLGEGIKATVMKNGDMVSIAFSDGEWTGKIIGFAVGWVLCLIPFITAIIGTVKQTSLPKSIGNDATMIASSF